MAICIKVNSSGSWANLIPVVSALELDVAKLACADLAQASVGDVSFKVVRDGETIAQFHKMPRVGEPHGWYSPRVLNPIQAGVDRTTSGAIGQP
jgi:hypothetical protein